MIPKIMVTKIEQLAGEFEKAGYGSVAAKLRTTAEDSRRSGIPESFELKTASRKDLRQETLDLLSQHTFREPTVEERRILGSMGYDTVLSTDAKPLSVVVAENPKYFWENELDYVNARPALRDYTPRSLAVALRPRGLFLLDSFDKSQAVQLQMHERESGVLQRQLPHARNIMLPASTYAQLDLAYFKQKGEVLFRDRYARALDETSGVFVAFVGRIHPGFRLGVFGWGRVYGYGFVGALSAVVFINE